MNSRFALGLALLIACPALAEEEGKSVETIAAETRPALVAITHAARMGGGDREGCGFVIDAGGLIATNLHVIGEARPIKVTLSDGRSLTVTEVHASDRKLDLAILRVAEHDLPMIPLGDSSDLPDGVSVVAMGNPQGFRFSVVQGVVSAKRDFEGVEMIQLAIPIEPGNSGGPLLDREGKVIGLPTMKSTQTANIGFAMPVNALKTLLEKPNPIPIDRWMTVGQLNPRKWKPLQQGALWRQRAGRISVKGQGAGFGGRALCLFQEAPPEGTYEVATSVKLDDENGAAGLAVASDGGDRHYGFYPSAGRLRLTFFDGPEVFSWNILAEVPSTAYRPGEWNRLRLRVEESRLTGFVNGTEVVSVEDSSLRGGFAGICKFRQTEAEFKDFQLGKTAEAIDGGGLNEGEMQALRETVNTLASDGGASVAIEPLAANPTVSAALLEAKAREFDERAQELRRWSERAHQENVLATFSELVAQDPVDLFAAGLQIARMGNRGLDVSVYLEELDAMAAELMSSFEPGTPGPVVMDRLVNYLFSHQGFHGSRHDYYSRENSFLSAVLDDREGLPITLSVLFIELARRVGMENVVGLPLPFHFVVQYHPEEDLTLELVDVFDGGKRYRGEEAAAFAKQVSGGMVEDLTEIAPATPKDILVRMLRNLIGVELDSEDAGRALPYLDLLLAAQPDAGQERLSRAILRYQSRLFGKCREDVDWLLKHQPEGVRLDRLEELRAQLENAIDGQ